MLKKSALAALALIVVPSIATAATERLPYNTPVVVKVANPVSSNAARVGDVVKLEVMQDVVVGGYVVIAKGATGKALVSAAQPAQPGGVPGQLRITYKWVRGVDNTPIGVIGDFSPETSQHNGNQAGQTVGQAQVAAQRHGFFDVVRNLNVVGGDMNQAGSMINGGNASISPSTAISSATIRNPQGVTISSNQRSTEQDTADEENGR